MKLYLKYDLQRLLELDSDNHKGVDDILHEQRYRDLPVAYRCARFDIRLSLYTVFHKDMIFTKLYFEVDLR